ncbi:Ubiquinone biosynthesis protein coq9, mitochondrial [Arthrobotrys conoides]|uniref:Ubiquinone biosynthesis protein n=1 Tax=Arthrobotrys conoides TaxID=74498 RepID=A0AAN8NAE7_9PEZI
MTSKSSHRVVQQSLLGFSARWKQPSAFRTLKNNLNGHRLNHGQGSAVSSASYTPEQAAILSAALSHVPSQGFTDSALLSGVKEAGYLDVTTNLFPQGPFDIVKYHLVTQRERLNKYAESEEWKDLQATSPRFGTTNKIRALCIERLKQNKDVIRRWPEAVALMKYPTNLQSSTSELFSLADTMWNVAGDKAVDVSWYTKRGILSGIYAATEVYMTQDKSDRFTNTWAFLDERLADSASVGSTVGRVGQYLDYARYNVVNVLRSKGVKI